MIDRLEISGIRLRLTPEIKNYVNTKIGGLENLLPTHARKSARGRVFLSRPHTKKNIYSCEVVLELPNQTIYGRQSAATILVAIDQTEDKLANQIRKYKTASSKRRARRLWSKLWRS